MPIWTICDYIEPGGHNPVAKWIEGIPPSAQAALTDRLLAMESLKDWQPKWSTKLTGWDGLVELRIPHKKVQYRPIGMYLPNKIFVILCGAIEKGDELPRRHLETADRRRKQLLKEPERVGPHEY